MKFLFISFLLASSLWAVLEPERCYEHEDGHIFAIRNPKPDQYELIVFTLGGPMKMVLKLVSRARCMDCNEDVFEITHQPTNKITFKGKCSDIVDPYSESGTVNGESYVRIKCPKSE